MSKEQLEEKQQEQADRELAQKLGISYDELLELEYEIQENKSNDDLTYGFFIQFSQNCDVEILKKIKGLEKSNTFHL